MSSFLAIFHESNELGVSKQKQQFLKENLQLIKYWISFGNKEDEVWREPKLY